FFHNLGIVLLRPKTDRSHALRPLCEGKHAKEIPTDAEPCPFFVLAGYCTLSRNFMLLDRMRALAENFTHDMLSTMEQTFIIPRNEDGSATIPQALTLADIIKIRFISNTECEVIVVSS